MVVVDLNILIYAYRQESPQHAKAVAWLEEAMNSGQPIGLSWTTILGFLRLMTSGRYFSPAIPLAEVQEAVQSWLAVPTVRMLIPGEKHADVLFGLLNAAGTAGDLTSDAHLAALAIEYRATMVSNDTDFLRFPKVKYLNPLR